jgi:hypothetical protein
LRKDIKELFDIDLKGKLLRFYFGGIKYAILEVG